MCDQIHELVASIFFFSSCIAGLEVPKIIFIKEEPPSSSDEASTTDTGRDDTVTNWTSGAQGEEVSKDSEDVPIEATDVPPDMESSDGSSGLQKCGQCGQYFSSAEVLLQHSVTHSWNSPFWCHNCGATFVCREDLAQHESMHVDKDRFCCALCSKIFVSGSVLRGHTTVHQDHPGYRCHLCPMVYATHPQLLNHLDSHNKPYKCKVCNDRFINIKALSGHASAHVKLQGVRPLRYKCPHCPRTFYHSGHLADHTRTHTGERPFSCDVCKKSFTRHSTLLAHNRMQHAI